MIISGVIKYIFDYEIFNIMSMWICEIKTIQPLLSKVYLSDDINTLLKKFCQ